MLVLARRTFQRLGELFSTTDGGEDPRLPFQKLPVRGADDPPIEHLGAVQTQVLLTRDEQ